MKNRKIAVLTDAMSPGFYFPLWYKYYSSQFGADSINVLTIPNMASEFRKFELASITEMDQSYDDNVRLAAITNRVTELLKSHDYVVHVDTDEFLIPDPLKHRSLSDYINNLTFEYVTARGFDVFQHNNETSLDMEIPILVNQRSHCFALTAMNKTCITSIPITWKRGFHFCSQPPRLDELFLFHFKRADVDQNIGWNAYLSKKILNDEFIRSYYETPPEKVVQFLNGLSEREFEEGSSVMYRDAFYQNFMAGLTFNNEFGVYESGFIVEKKVIIIPEQYRGTL